MNKINIGVKDAVNMQFNKGVKVALVASIIGVGSTSLLPGLAYGETNSSIPQGEQNVSSSTQKNEIATLTQIAISGATLNQSFSPNLKTYTAMVANDVKEVQLLLKSDDQNAVITVNGKKITSGVATTLTLTTGKNDFLIKVADGTEINTYHLTINRQQSNQNELQALTLSNGKLSPSFQSAITSYNVIVENEIKALTVNAKAKDEVAKIKVNDKQLTSKGASVNIPVGNSNIVIKVTAENGEVKTYTIHVTREAAKKEKSASQTTAKTETKKQTSKKDMQKEKKTPATKVTTEKHSFIADKTRAGKNKMEVKTMKLASRKTAAQSQTQSPSQFSAKKMKSTTTATVSFNQQTQSEQRTAFSNSKTQEKASTAILSALATSHGTWNKAFQSDEFTYHVKLSSNVSSVKISATPTYADASISIEDSTNNDITFGDQQSKKIISVVVKNGDDQKTYVLVFNKTIKSKDTDDHTEKNTETASSIKSTSASAATDTSTINKDNHTTIIKHQQQNHSSWFAKIVDTIGNFFKSLFN